MGQAGRGRPKRSAIGAGGRLVGASVLRGGGTPSLPTDPFRLGVASGDPLPDSVVLWTRLAVDPASPEPMPPVQVPVRWEIATDERFGKVVRSGERRTGPDLGHSVHVDARGLDASREYSSLASQFVDGALRNPHIHLYDITNKGYLRCEATPSQLRADFAYVTTIQQPQAEPLAGTSWVVESGKPGAQQA
jgi:phosphodiesterase/alkaline phosphatase D-like protein